MILAEVLNASPLERSDLQHKSGWGIKKAKNINFGRIDIFSL